MDGKINPLDDPPPDVIYDNLPEETNDLIRHVLADNECQKARILELEKTILDLNNKLNTITGESHSSSETTASSFTGTRDETSQNSSSDDEFMEVSDPDNPKKRGRSSPSMFDFTVPTKNRFEGLDLEGSHLLDDEISNLTNFNKKYHQDFPPPGGNSRHTKQPRRSPTPPNSRRSPTPPRKQPQTQPQQNTTSSSTPPTQEAKQRIPPVILRDPSKWMTVSKGLAEKNIVFAKAKQCADGIRIQAATVPHFRALTKFLGERKYEFHSYPLQEDINAKAVLWPVPISITIDEITQDLVEKNFEPIKVTRMRRFDKDKTPMPLILVEVKPSQQRDLFKIRDICSLVVRVEQPRKKNSPTQCHRCQRFHHAQRNCHANPRCVKCGNNHITAACEKPKEAAPTGANCNGQHTANYRGCPRFPKFKTPGKTWTTPRQASAPASQSQHPTPTAAPQTQPPRSTQAPREQKPAPPPSKKGQSGKKDQLDSLLMNLMQGILNARNSNDAAMKLAGMIPQITSLVLQT